MSLINLCVCVCLSWPWCWGTVWSVVWWRICRWSDNQVITLFKHYYLFHMYSPAVSSSEQQTDFFLNQSCDCCVFGPLRSTSHRGYRLPPCALINLSHGARMDHTSHKLTAIVKPQPVTGANFHSNRQLAGLNHSPQSPFIPTQVRVERLSSYFIFVLIKHLFM